ncbi:MAG: hypothetical protein AAF517_26060, partial [Planctomycetota bacterium]
KFQPTRPDDGSWTIVQSDASRLTAKGLLRISIESEFEYYKLRLSDGSDLEIRISYGNNHKKQFDRCVGKVVTVTGEYKTMDGKKVLVVLDKVETHSS